MMLSKLDSCTLLCVLSYHSLEDFIKLSFLISKRLTRELRDDIVTEMHRHLMHKWNIIDTNHHVTNTIFHKLIKSLGFYQLKEYLSKAVPCMNGLHIYAFTDDDIIINGNKALFIGDIGINNRSVMSEHSFPVLMNDNDSDCDHDAYMPPNMPLVVKKVLKQINSNYMAFFLKTYMNKFKQKLRTISQPFVTSTTSTSTSTSSTYQSYEIQTIPTFSTPFMCKNSNYLDNKSSLSSLLSLRRKNKSSNGNSSNRVIVYGAFRSIAYYEVAIRGKIERRINNDGVRLQEGGGQLTDISVGATDNIVLNESDDEEDDEDECIAVGLATHSFDYARKFPGWDTESYGFHSDDGGLFHGQGRKIGHFENSGLFSGTKKQAFGRGDTVGCGVDYINKNIFYTLNGQYLGVAFSDIDVNGVISNAENTGNNHNRTTQQSSNQSNNNNNNNNNNNDKKGGLFPTVGIDMSEVEVEFNFGQTRPFEYDLYHRHIKKYNNNNGSNNNGYRDTTSNINHASNDNGRGSAHQNNHTNANHTMNNKLFPHGDSQQQQPVENRNGNGSYSNENNNVDNYSNNNSQYNSPYASYTSSYDNLASLSH